MQKQQKKLFTRKNSREKDNAEAYPNQCDLKNHTDMVSVHLVKSRKIYHVVGMLAN